MDTQRPQFAPSKTTVGGEEYQLPVLLPVPTTLIGQLRHLFVRQESRFRLPQSRWLHRLDDVAMQSAVEHSKVDELLQAQQRLTNARRRHAVRS